MKIKELLVARNCAKLPVLTYSTVFFLFQIISVKTYGSFSPLLGTNAFPMLSLELLSLSCRRRLTGSENASPSMILLNF